MQGLCACSTWWTSQHGTQVPTQDRRHRASMTRVFARRVRLAVQKHEAPPLNKLWKPHQEIMGRAEDTAGRVCARPSTFGDASAAARNGGHFGASTADVPCPSRL